jgi:D-sedoheptulose 7-phosphate isomerase
MVELAPHVHEIVDAMLERRPDLQDCVPMLLEFHECLVRTFTNSGKLLICGNGGSCADAMHIAGELCKSFERKRPIPETLAQRLTALPFGEELGAHLETGLAAVTLGLNASLVSAAGNDSPLRDIAFAQETLALARPDDTLLAISTSGNARNCLMAMSVGKAVGVTTVALTGSEGGRMAEAADIALRSPGDSTKTVQEAHIVLYHTFCAMIEAHFFPEPR